jgi:alpha-galactosidase
MSGDVSASWSSIANIINLNAAQLNSVNFYGRNDMLVPHSVNFLRLQIAWQNGTFRDMMEIGNGALTIQEQRSHFAAWVFMKSPILLGTDVSANKYYMTHVPNKPTHYLAQ